jgi:catechol 2,3-dioxygenase-like lactoylglutathione lyase family enzyme
MVGDGALALADGLDELAHADLPFGGGRQHGEQPEADRIAECAESRRQLHCLVAMERGSQDRGAALPFFAHFDDSLLSGHGILPLTNVDVSTIINVSTFVDVTGGFSVSRVQLALNVADLQAAIDFYSKLFATEPAKIRPGYANFAIADPPLKLVLIEHGEGRGRGTDGALNHLGVEVETPELVRQTTVRLTGGGLEPEVQESTTCCYAVQDKAWVDDPDGAPWEFYTVLADAPEETGLGCSTESCQPEPVTVDVAGSGRSCC